MILYDVKGRLVKRLVAKFRIKWDASSRSKLQFRAKQFLKAIWCTDIVFEEFPVFGSLLKIDIYNGTKRIAIEINGPQHEKYNSFFHRGSPQEFVKSIRRDLTKSGWCELNNIKLVELIKDDIENASSFYAIIQNSLKK